MKILFRNIHLYLSLAAGLVIMSCCFTGAILVFEKELQEAFNKDRYFVKQGNIQLPIEQLITNVKKKYSDAKIVSVKIYPDPARSVEVGVTLAKKGNNERAQDNNSGSAANGKKAIGTEVESGSSKSNFGARDKRNLEVTNAGITQKPAGSEAGGGRPTHTVFVDPYSGQVLQLYNYRETFFYTMFALHRWLLGNESSIGKTITGIATFIFLFILITGIILWWPRNKAILKQRLKIKTDASFKRLNHDLHIVLGFYSAIFLFVFAFTALAWSFKWFNNSIYTITKSSMKPQEAPRSVYSNHTKRISYDSAFIAVSNLVTDVQYYTLRAPNDSTGIFSATVLPLGAHETATDNYYIDQYSGQVIGNLQFKDKNLGQRVRATFKPVHVGSIYGVPSKLIAFLACALGVTFPITGTIMWINRLRKKNRTKKTGTRQPVLIDEEFENE
jgi:uncharacterized iron-regulated membrane protein